MRDRSDDPSHHERILYYAHMKSVDRPFASAVPMSNQGIFPTPFNRIKNVLSASLNKTNVSLYITLQRKHKYM